MNKKEMIEEFQCSGCVYGGDTKCGEFKLIKHEGFFRCEKHVAGTNFLPIGRIFLGLPKGFNHVGIGEYKDNNGIYKAEVAIRLYKDTDNTSWDQLNVAVWALEKDGFLFVRTYMPRVNRTCIDVIQGGTLDLVPNAINVAEFYDTLS